MCDIPNMLKTNAEKVKRLSFTLRGELDKPAHQKADKLRMKFASYVGMLVEIDLRDGIIPYPPGKGPNWAGARKGGSSEGVLGKAIFDQALAGGKPPEPSHVVKTQPTIPELRRGKDVQREKGRQS